MVIKEKNCAPSNPLAFFGEVFPFAGRLFASERNFSLVQLPFIA